MDILLYNLSWMPFNIFLAVLGVIFGWLFLESGNHRIKILIFILWLLFIPNTIYLITDLEHLPGQIFKLGLAGQVMLLGQYAALFILGLLTYFLGLYPVDKALAKQKLGSVKFRAAVFILLNYLIAFAVTIGRFERVSSWYVVTDPRAVFFSSLNVFRTWEMVVFILTFGTVLNVIYFTWKKLR